MKFSRLASMLFVGAVLTCVAIPALAQDPCPCKDAPPPPPPPWSGKAELAYAGTSGNTSTSSFGLGLDVIYRTAPWTVEATFAFLRAESDHVVTAEALAGMLKGSRDLTKAIDVFVQANYQRNTFSGIDHRIGGSAGAGYKLIDQPDILLRPEASFGYTNEARTDDTTFNYATAAAALKFVWKFSKSADFTEEASWTEDLSDTQHWIFRNLTSISASLTNVLSLKVGWGLAYSNQPVPGFGKTDTVTSAAVVAKF